MRTLITLAALAAACSGGSSSSPGASGPQVTIQDFMFSPSSLTIKAGETVTWTNMGPSAHTTTSDTGVWNSAVMAAPSGGGGYGGGMSGGTFQFTFSMPGTYSYHCSLHPPASYPGFTGTITVTP
jgi:plastocyanin